MLRTVSLPKHRFSDYRLISEPDQYHAVVKLAHQLKGARVLHISATARGGGVAEILRSYIPLLKDLGLEAKWQVLQASQDFFTITKMIHNGLQGEPQPLRLDQWETYLSYNRDLADHIDTNDWDFIVIHDPQPATVISYCKPSKKPRWVWRSHIDTKHASDDFVHSFTQFLKPYDGMIFTMKKYLFGDMNPKQLAIINPAIDPLNNKNEPLSAEAAKQIVKRFGINPQSPLVLQVSRFDPWKNQLGTIESWLIARRKIKDLQLALVGDTADDDPQGDIVLKQLKAQTKGLSGLFIIHNKANDREVSALQDHATVVIQRSTREGFGLTVSEALWSKTPVIGSNVGGIPEQIKDGSNGYLVSSDEEAANKIVNLVNKPELASEMGRRGQSYVRQHFLLPRLIRDDLKFLLSL